MPSVRGPGSVKYAKNGIPVLVWIYGGGFCTELMQIQYTTAKPCGKLWGNCCEHELPTGSVRFMASTKGGSEYGLHDQNLALRFVKRNIANFEGIQTK